MMPGIRAGLVGSHKHWQVTIEVSGANYGYNTSYGSISPATPIFDGQELTGAWVTLGSWDFKIRIDGSFLAQDFFTKVIVTDGDGNQDTYLTASAGNFATDALSARWDWGDGGAPLPTWDDGDGGKVRNIRIE